MSTQMLLYVIYAVGGIFGAIVVAYLIISKKMQKSDYQKIQKLRQGTKSNGFSIEILYQKLYIAYSKIPYIKSKVFKLRRRLEIINVDDEFNVRRNSAIILTRNLIVVLVIMTLSFILTHSNYLLMSIIFIYRLIFDKLCYTFY